ncbi:hypothetical protein D9M71_530000 [compost metagenome]
MPEHRTAVAARGSRPDHRTQARHPGTALPGRLRAGSRQRPGGHLLRALHHSRLRRRQQGLPLYQQPGRQFRRRHRHGLARRLQGRQPGVQPVPPDLPVPPAGQELPDDRSAARRRRPAAPAQRRTLHAALRRARRTGPARHRRPRHRPRDEAPRHRLRLPRHQPQAGRLHQGALPHRLRTLPGLRHRHHPRAHPGGAGGPLHLRRRGGRPARPHRRAEPLRHRRNHLHRPARRQPAGQQLAAGMLRLRPLGGGGHPRQAR